MFSEPLSPKFVIYAEGQAPTDIMKGTGSFSIDNNFKDADSFSKFIYFYKFSIKII